MLYPKIKNIGRKLLVDNRFDLTNKKVKADNLLDNLGGGRLCKYR